MVPTTPGSRILGTITMYVTYCWSTCFHIALPTMCDLLWKTSCASPSRLRIMIVFNAGLSSVALLSAQGDQKPTRKDNFRNIWIINFSCTNEYGILYTFFLVKIIWNRQIKKSQGVPTESIMTVVQNENLNTGGQGRLLSAWLSRKPAGVWSRWEQPDAASTDGTEDISNLGVRRDRETGLWFSSSLANIQWWSGREPRAEREGDREL
jgi:hypothetical protein